jgi:nucleotide-binding universal stress UspA family protein
LEWAAREGIVRNSAVRVVAGLTVSTQVDDYGVDAVQRVRLTTAVDEVRRRHDGLRVDASGTHLGPNHALVAEAVGEALMVVGASAWGTAHRWLLGSVPRVVSRRSSCPVVVVHGTGRDLIRRIVVGVDSGQAAEVALDWAIDEANLHDADVMVVHAWERPSDHDRSLRNHDLRRTGAACALDLAVHRCEQHTHRTVRGTLCEGDAAHALTTVATVGDLLVVGSRGQSGFKTMLFGSVALAVIERAECPVVVVHPRLRPAV